MKRLSAKLISVIILLMAVLTACGISKDDAGLADGTYICSFNTDSTMFKVNEACEGKALLTVDNGEMSVHISLPSKNTVNLYPGLKEDAQAAGAVLLEPTVDTVRYSDGLTEDVHGFDVPVPAIDEEFDLALIGTKGKWYDHKVSVSDVSEGDAVPGFEASKASGSDDEAGETDLEENDSREADDMPSEAGAEGATEALAEGVYSAEVVLEGGSGKASITSPAELKVENGHYVLKLEFSSDKYDYMLYGDKRYEADTSSGLSVFNMEADELLDEYDIVADTTAMSKPHEIEYKVKVDLGSITAAGK